MNHKRGRPKSRRAGCLTCKPHKDQRLPKEGELGHRGFGKIRKREAAKADLRDFLRP